MHLGPYIRLLPEGNGEPLSPQVRSFPSGRPSLTCSRGKKCHQHKFYDQYLLEGSGLFCDLQAAVEDSDAVDLTATLNERATRGIAPEEWTATYTPINKSATTQIHAIHLAAGLGSIELMEWIKLHCGPGVLSRKATIRFPGSNPFEHYTPLMSALFMSQVEAVIWLLDNNADASMANHDGFTPLHLLALFGMPHVPPETRQKAMQRVAAKLVERRADLAARSGPLAHRTDPDAELERNKRPLEIAALKTRAYPKQMLHLLTTSYQCPEQSKLFEEVHIIAKANPSGAETLMDNVKANISGQLKEKLIQEVLDFQNQMPESKHVEMLATILRMSPVAGAELLKLMVREPKVRDPHRYPLPPYTTLPNRVMRCTYQPVSEWVKGDAPPKWHSHFKQDLPGDPLRHDRVYEVKVRVLSFPGILDLRVLTILSRVWYYGHHMRIFAQLPIQAIICCMWSRSWPTFCFLMGRELTLLLVLLSLGIHPPPHDYTVALRFIRTVVLSEMLSEAWSLTSGLLVCSSLAGMPRSTYFFKFHIHGFLQMMALSLFTLVDIPIATPEEKVVVAVNILMTCFILVTRLRTVPELGPLIIAVLRSFAPMQNMFILMFMVFIPFFCAFATIKDDKRDLWYVGLYLYRSLFLNDGDATEALSGFDYGGEQTLDFNQEQFTGDGSGLILHSSTAFMVIATVLFSIVLLNLVIGMYSKFYDEMQPFAELLFHQQRAKASVSYMLSAGWLQWALGDSYERYGRVYLLLAAGCLLFCSVLFVVPTDLFLLLRLIPWTLGIQLCQATLVSSISAADEQGNYLWISYRSDYSDEYYLEYTNQELNKLRRQLGRAESTTQAELHELKRLVVAALRPGTADFPLTDFGFNSAACSPSGGPLAGGTSAGGAPAGGAFPFGAFAGGALGALAGGAPAGGALAGGAPAGGALAGGALASSALADSHLAGIALSGGALAGGALAGGALAGGALAGGATVSLAVPGIDDNSSSCSSGSSSASEDEDSSH